MKELDVPGAVEFMKKNPNLFPDSCINEFGGSVASELSKVKIAAKLETRDHKFTDGEIGQVCQKLTIEVDFSDLVLQPHQDFEDDFTTEILEAIAGNIALGFQG